MCVVLEAREIFARFAASKVERAETASWKRRRVADEVDMNVSLKFSRHALALLFVVTMATATASAQQQQTGAEGKIILPPKPVPPLAQPPLLTLPAKPVADKLAPPGWTRYEIGEPAEFSLILPAEPDASVERMNIIPGAAMSVRVYLSSADSGVYGATFVEGLPAAAMNEDWKRTFFESFMTSFVDGFQETVKNRGVITSLRRLEQRAATAAGGLTGYEQDFSYDKLMGRVRLVFDGGRAYAVMAVWNGFSTNNERSTFFESLTVNTKR